MQNKGLKRKKYIRTKSKIENIRAKPKIKGKLKTTRKKRNNWNEEMRKED